MLRLNESERRRLSQMEKQSFLRFCKRLGHSPEERASLILQGEKEDLIHLSQTISEDPTERSAFVQEVRPYIDAPDLWTLKRLAAEERVSRLTDEIAANRTRLPIDWPYLRQLAQDMALDLSDKDKGNLLRAILLNVPHIRRYDLHFNAFVKSESLLGRIPCVCVYELLITASRFFADVVARRMFRVGSSVELVGAVEAKRAGTHEAFMIACHECLEMALCKTDVIRLSAEDTASHTWPHLTWPIRLMAMGSQDFAWYHEYGHMLMGHLAAEQGHDVEYAADTFAWQLIKAFRACEHPELFWYRIGALSLLAIIHLLEVINKQPESATHPTAFDRLASICRDLEEPDRFTLFSPVGAMLALCEATLSKCYGVQYEVPL